MQNLHPAMDRKTILTIALITAAALAAAVVLSLVVIQTSSQAVNDAYASMIAIVSEKYPLAEEEVVRDIRTVDQAAITRGRSILRQYGLDTVGLWDTAVASTLTSWLLPGTIILVLVISAAFAALYLHYRKTISTQIAGLSNYLQHLEQGKYDLDIRDNGEGTFSRLKNDLYKITIRLREQAEMLKKEKEHLSDSIADISHQIKTPLTSLTLLVDLLAENPPENDQKEFVSRMRSQLGRIQWLISALLKLARLDARTANLECEPVNIRRLVDMAIEPHRLTIELKQQQLEIQGDSQASFNGDIFWSAEALSNLIRNCVEHTLEGGSIVISYHENPLYAEITVADTGEGIESNDLPKIFQRFYRGKNASENSIGIGLALAKAIFVEQGGDITVSSQPGQGTRFSVKVYRGVVRQTEPLAD